MTGLAPVRIVPCLAHQVKRDLPKRVSLDLVFKASDRQSSFVHDAEFSINLSPVSEGLRLLEPAENSQLNILGSNTSIFSLLGALTDTVISARLYRSEIPTSDG